MAAQEAIHGLHNPPYAKNEPSNNGYDYNYAINDGSYGNHHYNPYMHYGEPQHSYEHHLPPHHHYPPHPNGPGQESHHHNLHYAQPPIPSNVNHHQHLHHYGHTMDGGMSLNPPSHYNMMPGSNHSGVYKEESAEDPYSFVDEETGANRSLPPVQAAGAADAIKSESNAAAPAPKKRGRKKKVVAEPGLDGEPPMTMDLLPLGVDSADGQPTKRKYTKSEHYKQRRRHDRFNGMTEEEVRSRTLPDHLASNLDVVIIGINPGLFAAYKGHHYAGPGNHFWKCLYLAGLVPEPMTADDDFKLVHFGIGFTNMVARATKGSADLTRKEIREGGRILLEKLQQYRPKIAVFNGKGIYEVFSGKKEFTFGKQPECIDGTNTFIWVMPSSSARCAQLPRAMDKVPFYSALKKFRDYLNGLIPEIDENEVIFNDPKIRAADDGTEISEHLKVDSLSSDDLPALVGGANELPTDERQQQPTMAANPISSMAPLENGTAGQIPVKKKRGRPKKIRIDGVIPVKQEQSSVPTQASSSSSSGTSAVGVNGELVNGQPPKKKRGRPKKIRTEEIRPAPPPLTDANGGCSTSNSNSSVPMENRGPPSASPSAPTYMGHPFGVATNQQQQHQPQPSSTIGHHPSNQQQQQQHPHVVDYYGRAPSTSGSGGPLSGLCNDMSPHPSSSSTPQPTTCSPRQMEFDTSVRDGSAISGQMNVGQPHAEHRMTPAENGDARHHQMTSPGIGKSQQEQQQQLAQPPRSHPGTPQPSMGYRPTPPAIGVPYHVPNQVKDVASKSLSGLESLVDQIPNMNDGGGNGGGGVEPQHQHPNGMHVHTQPGAASATATTSAVPTSFGHHYPAPSQPSFSYPSTSFGHYAPHYTSPNGGSFPPNLYHTAGGQEFNRTGPGYPMTFAGATASQMNHRAPPHAMAGFPYSSYGQTYPPHPPPPNSAPAFSPYPAPSPASGFHPNTSYAYPSASGSTYAPSYTTQAGYLNANATLDRPKDDRTDPAFGGYQ